MSCGVRLAAGNGQLADAMGGVRLLAGGGCESGASAFFDFARCALCGAVENFLKVVIIFG